MATVSIVIPTLFPPKHLAAYTARLTSFRRVTKVIVVVNGIGQNYDADAVHWRFLGKNRGYTGACNEGAHAATGDILLFLNDDCELSAEALVKMADLLAKNQRIVAVQPIVMKRTVDDERQVENIGFWVDTKIGKAYPVRTIKGTHEALNQAQNKKSVYGLSGTCLLIRKDIFDSVGMWDESFHSYLEDVDLAIRLYKAGYKVAPCLDAEVTHTHMATSSKMGLYKPMQDVKNWWRLVCKHPEIFPLTLPLLLERGRNVSGLVKAWAYKTFTP